MKVMSDKMMVFGLSEDGQEVGPRLDQSKRVYFDLTCIRFSSITRCMIAGSLATRK